MAKAKDWKKSKGDGHLTTISGIYPATLAARQSGTRYCIFTLTPFILIYVLSIMLAFGAIELSKKDDTEESEKERYWHR
jgi:hypothetical protein